MKNKYLLVAILSLWSLATFSQSSNWKYIRPSNTGLGGDYFNCIRTDACGNVWTGGYLPFWSEGSVARINNDGSYSCWSNFEGYIPADRVYDIAFGDNGVWIATNGVGNGVAHGGITHYDGTTWTTWTSANSPLPQDDMRGIAVDHNGVVWATFLNTQDGLGGVARFDGTNWTIYQPSNGFPTPYVNHIVVDAQNNIWVSTDYNGLLKFNGSSWSQYDNTNSGLTNYAIKGLEYDETNNKLYAVTGNSINIFDGTNWSHIDSSNSPLPTNGLWGVAAKGNKLIVTTVGGTYKTYVFNGTTWTSRNEIDHTYDATIDNQGNFWTAGNGEIAKYDGTTWTEYGGKNTGLTSMFNDDIFIDNQNRAWFSSNDNGGTNVFYCPKWQDYNNGNAGLWPSPINYTASGSGVAQDSHGDIWMLYQGALGGVIQVPNGNINNPAQWTVWDNSNSGISLQEIKRAAGDLSGNLWIGYSQACSVSKYSHATNSWVNYNLYALGQLSCGAGSGIKSIRVDPQNNVWVCGLAGLAKFDQTSWIFYSHLNTPLPEGIIMDIAFDPQGNKWVATEHGLYKFDGTTWALFTTQNSGMIGNFVSSVVVSSLGVVWIGCHNPDVFPVVGGLCSYNGTTWTQYTTVNSGLQEKYIDRMAWDQGGNLWLMSATHGAAIFNPNGVNGYQCLDNSLTCNTLAVSTAPVVQDELAIVYPNPVITTAIIALNPNVESVSLFISDISGKTVLQLSEKRVVDGRLAIDLSTLQSGIYFCTLAMANSAFKTLKIVKQ